MPNVGRAYAVAGIDTSIPAEERYQIIGRIASGGMAEIYLARMLMNGVEREVVLKRLMPELQNDQEFVQMFYDEANIASQLAHPNIVQIFELGELDGSLFIGMELLRGVNLRDILARLHQRAEALPPHLAVRIASNCLAALHYAHDFRDAKGRRLNVVHRDVSPQNIMVTFDGVVKLVDFGVAKAEGRLHQTRAGLIKGKFAYMSPEQVGGGQVDGRSDIFALAEVFYEILLKRHPFYAQSDMEVLRAILDKDPPHPCSLDGSFPPSLGEILIKAMRKAPGDRFADAGAMQDALERFLQEQRTPATTTMLARFMSDLYRERLDAEQAARNAADDVALIDSMTAEYDGAAQAPAAEPEPAPAVVSDYDAPMPQVRNDSQRDRIVEISRPPEHSSDPAERGAPAFLAHSGYTDPKISRNRFQNQIRGLFDGEEVEDRATDLEMPVQDDDAELPTMLGQLSAEELAQIRGGAAQAHAERVQRQRDEGVSVRPVDPANVGGGMVIERNSVRPPKNQPKSAPKPNVTHRSQTVLGGDQKPAAPAGKDKLGLVFFIVGLTALIGAVAYAIWLYSSSRSQMVNLVLHTTPPGATIYLDGADTGATTPQKFENIKGNKAHKLEFKLNGYQPCNRTVPADSPAEVQIVCDLKPSS